jgi:integrase
MARKRKRARRGTRIIETKTALGLSYAIRVTERLPGREPSRVFVTLKATTPEDAEVEAAEVKRRIKQGLSAVPVAAETLPVTTIKALVEDFCTTYQSDDVWDIKQRRRELRSVFKMHLVPFLGDADPEAISIEEINRYKDTLSASGRTDSRKRRVLTDTQLMFSWALSRSKLRRHDNPWERVDKPTLKPSTDHYTEAEVAALLDWCQRNGKHELHAIITFLYYTGCRRGEVAAVRWSDVDYPNEKIDISRSWKREARKTGDVLTVNLHQHLAAVLKSHRARMGTLGDGLIFPSSKLDKNKQRTRMLSFNTLWGLDDARDGVNAEVEEKGEGTKVRTLADPFHSFRHTHGTALAMQDASLPQIMAALGQKTESMARRYTHLAGKAAKRFVDALPVMGKVLPLPSKAVDRQSADDTEGKNVVSPVGFEPTTNGLKAP